MTPDSPARDVADTTYFLENQAEADYQEGQRLIRQIERLERELVEHRDQRDLMFRRAAEMRVAANILRDIGLRSETTPTGPLVALDNPLKHGPSDDR